MCIYMPMCVYACECVGVCAYLISKQRGTATQKLAHTFNTVLSYCLPFPLWSLKWIYVCIRQSGQTCFNHYFP